MTIGQIIDQVNAIIKVLEGKKNIDVGSLHETIQDIVKSVLRYNNLVYDNCWRIIDQNRIAIAEATVFDFTDNKNCKHKRKGTLNKIAFALQHEEAKDLTLEEYYQWLKHKKLLEEKANLEENIQSCLNTIERNRQRILEINQSLEIKSVTTMDT